MKRTSQFSILQATAAILAIAIVLWSIGLTSIRYVEAANVTSLSDTLSSSAPTTASDHTITFVTPTGVTNGEDITIDFSDGPFVVGSVDFTDIDVQDDTTDLTVAADCSGSEEIGASFSGSVLTLTFCSGTGSSLPANGTTTIEIGENATFGTTGDAQLTNPAAGPYDIAITAGGTDTGTAIVAIVDTVTVTASVDTLFTFTVDGVATGQTINADSTGGSTTATEIPFGVLEANTASTAAQDLVVTTNARNGFIVTVQSSGQLVSETGADIDGYRNGNYDTTPVAWEGPSPSIGSEETYGHWGLTSNDPTLTESLTDIFDVGGSGGDRFVSASTTPVEVFRHDGPVDGSGTGEGTTRVGYKIEISALQEAASDYQATLTYVATPVF
jgi:hypothetical protein